MLTPFEDNARARETVTTTDDNGVIQFVPNTILQAEESWEPSGWGIVFGTNCITPLSSVVVTVSRALALSSKGVSMALVRSIRGEGEVMGGSCYIAWRA